LALIDMIQQQLDDSTVSRLSQQLGTDPDTTRQAVPAALTALLGGLSHNVQQPGGAQQLDAALADHGGSLLGGGLLNDLGGLLSGGAAGSDGGGILSHIFGNHQPAVASQVGQKTGLDTAQAGRLLVLLAPLVLAYLARRRQQQPTGGDQGYTQGGGDGGVIGSIGDILKGEHQQIEQNHPQHSGLFDILGKLAGGLLGGGR
jgi:hypothetical protein